MDYDNYPAEYDDPAYNAYLDYQGRHSDCAYTICRSTVKEECLAKMDLDCYQCGTYPNPVKRAVVRDGAVVNPADPTQTYVLSCGHITI